MFSYYGSKSRVIKFYPRPKYHSIIEPFAGSARYSLLYFEHDITIVDKSKIICDIWNYLKSCSKSDIEKLPILNRGDDLRNIATLSAIEKSFLGFVVNSGTATPSNILTKWGAESINYKLKYIANSLFKIKHWEIINDCYKNLLNIESTWFIDPPYQFGGDRYIESNKNIDFYELSNWCKSRFGQVIVCENSKADWLPFHPLKSMHGQYRKTIEVIWTKNSDNQIHYKENNLFNL